ncbi:stage II sporulation protein D [Acidaminobacterium chupaoyuni]
MKRIFMTALLLLVVAYGIPLVTMGITGGENPQSGAPSQTLPGSIGQAQQVSGKTYDEKTTITLLRGGETVTLTMKEYLAGVVAAEMPASFPMEALKAQAVAARTYTLYKLNAYEQGAAIPESHKGAQLCDDPGHCKAYTPLPESGKKLWGENSAKYEALIRDAVESTNGMIVTYDGQAIAAVFHAASSGHTEAALDVWGSNQPYLVSVESPGEEECPKYRGEITISAADFAQKFKAKHPEALLEGDPAGWFKNSTRSQTGGIIHTYVGGVSVSGIELRTMLGLYSTNFRLKTTADSLTFTTTGYGHGVGMSQYGARELAEEGKTFEEILKWYYHGTEVTLKN